MRSTALLLLLLVALGSFHCAGKDPSGYLTQMQGALEGQDFAMALIYSSRHSEQALNAMTDQLLRQLGKARFCAEMKQAVKRMQKEGASLETGGRISSAKDTNEAFRRLANTEFNLCH